MRWTESDLETLFAVLEALSDTNQEKSEKDTCKGAEAVDHDITNLRRSAGGEELVEFIRGSIGEANYPGSQKESFLFERTGIKGAQRQNEAEAKGGIFTEVSKLSDEEFTSFYIQGELRRCPGKTKPIPDDAEELLRDPNAFR